MFEDPFRDILKPKDPHVPGDDFGGDLGGGGGGGEPSPDLLGPSIIVKKLTPNPLILAFNDSGNIYVELTVTDVQSGVLNVTCNGIRMLNPTSNIYTANFPYIYNINYAGSTKTDTFNIIATDLFGNISNIAPTATITYGVAPDTTPPSISYSSISATSIDLTNSTTSASVTFNVNTTDSGGISSVSMNNGASQVYQYSSTYIFTKTFNFNDYNYGSNTVKFTATAIDNAGNSSSVSQNITINKFDTQSPSISSFTGPSSLNISSSNQTATYTVVATDNRGVNSVSISGASLSSQSGSTYTFTESFSTSNYSYGTTNITRTATVSDAAGNTSTSNFSFNVVRNDIHKPTISKFQVSNSSPSLTTTNQSISVSYSATATDNVGITSYSVNGASYSSKSGNDYYFTEIFSYANYNFGNTPITRTVTFRDAAGNTATSSINLTISKTDNQSPVISSFTANDTSVTLTSSNTTQTVTYTAVVSDNVGVSNVSVSGLTFSSQSGNNYYFTKTFSYDNYSYGSHSVTHVCVATDSAGNNITRNTSVTVTKSDDQSPSISEFTVNDSSINVTSSNTSQSVIFGVTCTDNRSVHSVSVSGATYTSTSGNTRYFTKTYSFNSYNYGTTNISETATVVDAAGNSTTSSKVLTVTKSDTTSPSISAFTVNDASVSLTTSSQSQTVTFTVTATDNRAVNSVSINNGASSLSTSGNNYYFTKTFRYDDYNWGSQTVVFTAIAIDAAGNSTSSNLNVVVSKSDNQSPVISNFSVNNNVSLTTSSTSQTVTYTVTASDNRTITSFNVNGGASGASGSGSTRTFTETFNYADYSFGTHTISRTATVSDAAGNTDSDLMNFTLTKTDNQSPIISNYSAANTSLAVTSTNTTTTATFTATITDNVAINYVKFEGNIPTGTSGNTYTYVKTYNYSSLSFGSNTFTIPCYAQDTAGNYALVYETITITKTDNSQPTISNINISTNPTLTTDDQTESIIISADIVDNVGVNSYSVPGATFVSKSGNTYTWSKNYNYDDFSYGASIDNIVISASDSGGNSTSDNIETTVTKRDTQAPTISSFSVDNATVKVYTDSKTSTTSFTAVVSDNVGIHSLSVSGATSTGSSGNSYYFNKTYNYDNLNYGSQNDVVTLTVNDAEGNTSTDTITLTIIKTDNQAPSINSFTIDANDVSLLSSDKIHKITFSANVTDNVGVSSLSLSGGVTPDDTTGPNYTWTKIYDYDDYNYGTVSDFFTLTATDAAGNSSNTSRSIKITKIDDSNPNITSIGRKNGSVSNVTSVSLLASTENTETITFYVNVTDNVEVTNVTLTGATAVSNTANQFIFTKSYSFADYSFGSTTDTLTATASDAAGNTDTFNTSITVIKSDNVAPTITNFTQSATSVTLLASTENTATVSFSAVITDNVSVNNVSFDGLDPSISGNTYTWSKNYTFDNFGWGTSTDNLTLTVTDTAGNSTSSSKTVSIVKRDDIAPTITSFSANPTTLTWLSSPADTNNKTVTFTAVVTDNRQINSISVSGATQTNVSGNTYTFTKSYARPSISNSSSDTVILTVSDGNQNSTDSVTINSYYNDNTNPTISSFSADDTTVSLLTSSQSQTVTYTAVVTDNDAISNVKFNNNDPTSISGNTYKYLKTYAYGSYNFGNTNDTISVTATDNTGNTSSDSVTVTITKTDDESPSIISFVASDSTPSLSTSSQTASVNFTVVASDNVGINGISVSGSTLISNTGNTWGFTRVFSYSDYSFGNTNVNVVASVSDSAGNSVTSSITLVVSKGDNQAPSISNFSVNDSSVVVSTSSQSQTITFSVTATDNVAISSVSVPGATYSSTSGNTRYFTKTYNYSGLNYGTVNQEFTATVTDSAGNTDSESLTISVTKNDNQSPAITSFSVSDNTIALTTDSQTQTVTFSLVATDNRTITSKSVTGASFVSQSGNTFTFSRTFSYSDYNFGTSTRTITATVGDAAGNTTSDTLSLTITKTDNQNPTITSWTSASVTNFSNVYTSQQTNTETFTCVASDNVSIASVSFPGATATSSSSPFTFTKTYSYSDYNFGQNSLSETVTVTDTAGNQSNSTINYTVNKYDNQNPTIASFVVDDSTVVLNNTQTSQTVTYTASISDNRAVTGVTIDGQSITGSGNTYTYDKTYSFGDYGFGSNTDTVSVVATDSAGNSATDSVTVSISKSDTQNPTITSLTTSGTSNNNIVLKTSNKSKTVTFTAVVSDNVGINSISLTGATQTSSNNGTYTFTKNYHYDNYSYGSHTDVPTLTVGDAAGNSSTQTITVGIVKQDDQNPVINSFSANDTSVSLTTSNQSQTVIFTVAVSDNVAINSVSIPGTSLSSSSSGTYTFTKTYDYGDYSFGSSNDTLVVTVADTAGNSVTDSLTISIVKTDNQVPTINSFTTSDNSFQLTTSSQTKTVTYSVNASDNVAIDNVSVSGATYTGTSGSARVFSRSFTYGDYNFGSNTTTVTVTATDTGGNVSTDTITHTITKVDNQSPTVSNMTTNASGNAVTLTSTNTSQTVRYTISGTDNRSVTGVTWEGSQSSTATSGNNYYFDKTYNYSDFTANSTNSDTVSVVVTDAAGNTTNKSKTITITTEDNISPTISSFLSNKEGNVVSLLTSSQSNTVTWTVVSTDNVSVTGVSLPGTTVGTVSGNTRTFTKTYSYSDYNFGDTSDSLTVTVTDAAGNSTTSTINMVIRKTDNQSPSISSFSANDTSVSLTTGSQTQTVTFTCVTTDNRGISSVSIPGTTSTGSSGNNYTFTKTYSYSDYSFGNSSESLTVTVTDAAGNSATDSINIGINKADTANPSISSFTADDTTVALTTTSQNQTVTFTVVSTDNVGVSSVTIPGTTSTGSSGNNYTFTKAYSYGDYSFGSSTDTLTATSTDSAGNSITDNITINISKSDNQSPSISSTGNSSGVSASSTSVALKTSDQTKSVTFTATISDNVGISSVSFGGLTPSISGNYYTWTKTYDYDDYSFGSSTDTLTLTVADSAGNTVTDSVTINISKSDDQNPTVGNMTANNSTVELSTSSQSQTVTFSVVASDNVGVNSVTWEGSQDSSSISGNTYNFQRTYNYSNYSVGSTNSDTISVVVTDAAGNSTTKSKTITIITEDDQDPVISSLTSNKSSNIVLLPTSAQSNTVTFTVTATDNVGINSVTLSGATYSSKSGNNWIFTKVYSYANFSFGNSTDTLTATATDGVGNSVTSTINMSVRKSDDQSPSISSFSANDTSVELKTSSQSQTVTFTVVASDNRSVSSVSVPGTSAGSVSGNNYSFSKTYSYGDYSFGDSSDTLTATVTDAAGNSSSDTVVISINKEDDQNPSISSFSTDDTSVSLLTTSQSQTVTFTAVVSDNVAINTVSLPGTSLSSSSGGTYIFTKEYDYDDYSFGSSSNNLTLTVTDTAGNSVTDTVTIGITKSDDENPSISNFSANDTSVELKTSSQSQTVIFTVVAADNVGITSVSIPGTTSGESGSGSYTFTKTYSYGDYNFGSSSDTLTATVNDSAGNSTTDTITISITKSDDQNPIITNLSANDTSV